MSLEIFIDSIPIVASGLELTIFITVFSFIVGQVVALPLALAATSSSIYFRIPASTYILLVRGSPLLVQLFIIYYGLGQITFVRSSFLWVVLRDPVNCAIIGIGLNSAGYVAELVRGAIGQIPRGHLEAARTLGMSPWHSLSRVVLPQAYRAIFPLLGNEVVLVMKASSLASVVTVMEVTGAAKTLVATTYAPFEVFIVAGAIYLLMGIAISGIFQLAERWLTLPGSKTNHA